MNTAQIKEIIRRDLPIIMQEDMEIQSFILHIARTHFADKRETESRFDRILDELRRDREEQSRKWDEQKIETQRYRDEQKIETQRYREEQNTKWDEQNRKWDENQQDIRKLFDKYDTGIGALGSRWGLLYPVRLPFGSSLSASSACTFNDAPHSAPTDS